MTYNEFMDQWREVIPDRIRNAWNPFRAKLIN